MLTINKVTKKYNIKKKNEVIALKDIDLSFENKGLVFVVGSSGSGKTTLMNIIGGIESPTNGNVQINNKNIGNTEKELEIYRNKYIGLVFKDNNLIDNITVYDNLSLVCSQKDKIENYLEKLGLKKYENRYPNELDGLSGGQIQKIAIARSLLKEAEILLLDEPTWNLNEQTSKEIYDLLKEIAKEKLVIVVTQTKKVAEEYADRIIELKDGIVVTDRIIELKDGMVVTDKIINKSENKLEIKEKEKKKINKDNLLKLVLNNIKTNKHGIIFNILIMCLCFICVSISFSIVDYNRIDADIKNLKTIDEIETFTLEYNNRTNNLSYSQVEQIKEKFPEMKYIQDGVINSSQDIIDLGMEFYDNYNEIKDDGIYIFEYKIQEAINNGKLFYDENGVNVIKKTDEINYENLSNTYLLLENSNYKKYLRIDGIIKNLYDSNSSFSYSGNKNYYDLFQYKSSILYLKNSLYDNNFSHENKELSFINFQKDSAKVLINDKEYDKPELIFCETIDDKILTDSQLINTNSYSHFYVENENDIYISLPLYNLIFNENFSLNYFLDVNENENNIIKNYPNHIGEKISLEIIDPFYSSFNTNYSDLTLKGVILSEFEDWIEFKILLDENKYNEMYKLFEKTSIYIDKDSIKNIDQFVSECAKLFISPYYICSQDVINFEKKIIEPLRIINIFLLVLISLISFIVMYNYFNKLIRKYKKELGVLRTIGLCKKNIINMFISFILIITLCLIIFVIPISSLIIYIENEIFAIDIYGQIYLLFYKWWYTFAIICFIMLIMFITSFIVLLKVKKTKIICLIRHCN